MKKSHPIASHLCSSKGSRKVVSTWQFQTLVRSGRQNSSRGQPRLPKGNPEKSARKRSLLVFQMIWEVMGNRGVGERRAGDPRVQGHQLVSFP